MINNNMRGSSSRRVRRRCHSTEASRMMREARGQEDDRGQRPETLSGRKGFGTTYYTVVGSK
jgi:hypothetical protein